MNSVLSCMAYCHVALTVSVVIRMRCGEDAASLMKSPPIQIQKGQRDKTAAAMPLRESGEISPLASWWYSRWLTPCRVCRKAVLPTRQGWRFKTKIGWHWRRRGGSPAVYPVADDVRCPARVATDLMPSAALMGLAIWA